MVYGLTAHGGKIRDIICYEYRKLDSVSYGVLEKKKLPGSYYGKLITNDRKKSDLRLTRHAG